MVNIPVYTNIKLKLAFEMGVVLSETAQQLKQPVTPEMIKKAEKILIKEFSSKTPTRLSIDMLVNTLAVLEPIEV